MKEITCADGISEGDYITGESGIYQIVDVSPGRFRLLLAAKFDEAAEKNTGWRSEQFVESLGSTHAQDEIENIEINDGDQLTYDAIGETATVSVDGQRVQIRSDNKLVPESMHMLALKADIESGRVSQR